VTALTWPRDSLEEPLAPPLSLESSNFIQPDCTKLHPCVCTVLAFLSESKSLCRSDLLLKVLSGASWRLGVLAGRWPTPPRMLLKAAFKGHWLTVQTERAAGCWAGR
jgi:hypothetical protein